MSKLDEIESNANRAIIERNEGGFHYKAAPLMSPEDALALVAALREIVSYTKDHNTIHTDECSYITTYNHKSLECDCYKSVIPETIKRNLGADAI